MKSYVTLFLAIFAIQINIFAQNTLSPNTYWQEHFVKKIKGCSHLNFQVQESVIFSDKLGTDTNVYLAKHYFISENTKQTYNEYTAFCIDLEKDSMKIVSFFYNELSFGVKTPDTSIFNDEHFDLYSFLYTRNIDDYLARYANFYLFPEKEKSFAIKFTSYKDSLINNTEYAVLLHIGHTLDILNDDNTRTPIFDTITYFIDKKTDFITKIVQKNNIDKDITTIYNFSNFTFVKNNDIDTIFDIQSPKYKNFRKYNFHLESIEKGAGTIGIRTYEDNVSIRNKDRNTQVVIDSIQNFPLKKINGKVTYLKDIDGWILLDFWTLNCRYCLEFFANLQKEQLKNKSRTLEQYEIKIIAINPCESTNNLFKRTVQRFNVEDISHAAKGIEKILPFNSYPRYFLISPDKQIVFDDYIKDNDYSDLLKAKTDYEKQHNLKP